MRTLIVTAFMSLDGVVDSPGGEEGYRNTGWTFKEIKHDPESYEIKDREQKEATAMLMGRVATRPSPRSGRRWTTSPEYNPAAEVRRLDDAHGDRPGIAPATILRSLDDVAALKETDGGPISVHGSCATLARAISERRADRPLPPAGVPGPARRRQAALQRRRQGQDDAERGRERVVGNGLQKLVLDVVR